MKFSDGSDQFAFKDRHVTYISRLQCVQAAIESQVQSLKENEPNKKVGLVTFNNEVNIIGDGSQAPVTINGDKLNNYETIQESGKNSAKSSLDQTVTDTHEKLVSKLYELEESGSTALGPGLLAAISMAAEGQHGSQVVLCTDGLANLGIGSLEEKKEDADGECEVEQFYAQVAAYAKSKGVTVNVISIKGEECDLETLAPIYNETGGEVQIVEPEELTKNFGNILQNPVIATNVTVKVKMHKLLEFRNEDELNLAAAKTLLKRELGNVTEDSEITFEYRMKEAKELAEMEDVDLSAKSIPFQTQIEYTKLDGMKCIRIITQLQEVSNDREEVEACTNMDVLAVNAVQQASKIAARGDF